jgi:ribosomal protein S12 methylthiotransferase
MEEKTKLGIVSLGCPKNTVDSEVLLGKAAQGDYIVCADPNDAEVVVVNTCGFIDEARDESMGTIRELARWKQDGRIKGLVVAGCMAQRYGAQIREAVPEVDSVIGMSEYDRFDGLLAELKTTAKTAAEVHAPWRTLVDDDANYKLQDQTGRLRVTPTHSAYLKISEGCSNACTFCSIPSFRGLFRSKPRAQVLTEARELVASGAQELNLISQDTTHYGIDLEGEDWQTGLATLLDELASIEGLRWIRLLYAYPGHVSDQLIEALARNKKVVPYIDMPIQHIATSVLKRMGRRHTRDETVELLDKLRARIPGLVLRTTCIVGFPGETEEEFSELLEFVTGFRFERLGAFTYSHEQGTPSGERFEDDVPAEVKQRRYDQIMQAQQSIATSWAQGQKGETIEAVIEGYLGDDEGRPIAGAYLGRTLYDAPEVDTLIELEGPEGVRPGTFIEARITAAIGYDLKGSFDAMIV